MTDLGDQGGIAVAQALKSNSALWNLRVTEWGTKHDTGGAREVPPATVLPSVVEQRAQGEGAAASANERLQQRGADLLGLASRCANLRV